MSVTCHLQSQDVLPAVISDLEDARLHSRLRLLLFCVSLLHLQELKSPQSASIWFMHSCRCRYRQSQLLNRVSCKIDLAMSVLSITCTGTCNKENITSFVEVIENPPTQSIHTMKTSIVWLLTCLLRRDDKIRLQCARPWRKGILIKE